MGSGKELRPTLRDAPPYPRDVANRKLLCDSSNAVFGYGDGVNTSEPIAIAGAGPSGLACAIALAKNGRAVVVHERSHCVGARFHGDFQGIENWSSDADAMEEFRAAGLEINFDPQPVSTGVAFDFLGRRYSFGSDKPIFYMVRRGRDDDSLDSALLRQALAAGVEVRFNSTQPHVRAQATGPRNANIIAVGYAGDCDSPDSAWIAFDSFIAPLGYAYLLVRGGQATIATTLFTDFDRQAKYLARTVEFFTRKTGVQIRNPQRFGGYGSFSTGQAQLTSPLLLGEGAGFQDPLAGFGIRYALRSGLLAARSILTGEDYAALVQREIAPLLRAGLANRWLIEKAGDRTWRWILRKLAAGADARVELGRVYNPSLRTRLIEPLATRRYAALT